MAALRRIVGRIKFGGCFRIGSQVASFSPDRKAGWLRVWAKQPEQKEEEESMFL